MHFKHQYLCFSSTVSYDYQKLTAERNAYILKRRGPWLPCSALQSIENIFIVTTRCAHVCWDFPWAVTCFHKNIIYDETLSILKCFPNRPNVALLHSWFLAKVKLHIVDLYENRSCRATFCKDLKYKILSISFQGSNVETYGRTDMASPLDAFYLRSTSFKQPQRHEEDASERTRNDMKITIILTLQGGAEGTGFVCGKGAHGQPGSSGSLVSGYGLDDWAIGNRSPVEAKGLSRPALGITQPPVQWVPGSFPRE
jgi:hypothetical protein